MFITPLRAVYLFFPCRSESRSLESSVTWCHVSSQWLSLILSLDLWHWNMTPTRCFPLFQWPDAKNQGEVDYGKRRRKNKSRLWHLQAWVVTDQGCYELEGGIRRQSVVWAGRRKWICPAQCLELCRERYLGQNVCLAIRTSEVVGLLLFIEPRGKMRCSFLASHETRCKTTAQHRYSDPQKEFCKVCPEKDRQRAKFK